MHIDRVMELVLKDAEGLEMDAGWGGSPSDGGAGRLRDQVKFYKYGAANELPPEWKSYTDKLDPEYDTFLRLKNKFEGR